MAPFSADFFSALLSIVVIDLVLAGDNAIVIGLAARKLPVQQQRKAVLWGTVGAVVIRSLLTMIAVYLLMVPGLMGIGGALLIWIAYKLLANDRGHEDVKVASTFGEALRTILIADAVMGLDNVLAVAGAAHGSFLLVVIGLAISVPIVVWGSTLILRLIERFPVIIYIGSGVLAFTAGRMIVEERLLHGLFGTSSALRWGFIALVIAGVIVAGTKKKKAAPAGTDPRF